MKIKFKNDEQKPRNRNWFAWRPVIAKDEDNNKYIVWMEQVFRAKTMDIISHYIYVKHYVKEGKPCSES